MTHTGSPGPDRRRPDGFPGRRREITQLRMTISHARTLLRGAADDPSGTRTAPPPARPGGHRAATTPPADTEPHHRHPS
jgi:hypothetical protein